MSCTNLYPARASTVWSASLAITPASEMRLIWRYGSLVGIVPSDGLPQILYRPNPANRNSASWTGAARKITRALQLSASSITHLCRTVALMANLR